MRHRFDFFRHFHIWRNPEAGTYLPTSTGFAGIISLWVVTLGYPNVSPYIYFYFLEGMIFHIKKNETKNYYTNIFWLRSIVIFLKWGKKVRKWWLSVVVAICLSGFHATLAFILLISFVRLLKMSLHFLWFFYFHTNIKNKRLKKLGGKSLYRSSLNQI